MKFNPLLENLVNYEGGKPIELVVREYGVKAENVIKLASNENPYGTPPNVTKKIVEVAKNSCMYPDDSMFELKDGLSRKFCVDSDQIIIGAGSDQVIDFCIKSKCTPNSKVLMSKTTFAMYEIYTKQTGAKIVKTASDEHNLDEFREVYESEGADIIFLCLPNNPLGECLDASEVEEFIKEVAEIDKNTLVVLDGAYQEYAKYKDPKKELEVARLVREYQNTIYLGTFSKAYGLGGLRVGYGISNSATISELGKLRPPFNITTLSLAAAIEALNSEDFVNMSIEKNYEQMSRYEEFSASNGFGFIESYTNFLTIKLPSKLSSKEYAQKLLEQGIIVRDLTGYGLNAIRVTIGSKEQNDRALDIMQKSL
jgi:histidinol-phosphate aminotransferase